MTTSPTPSQRDGDFIFGVGLWIGITARVHAADREFMTVTSSHTTDLCALSLAFERGEGAWLTATTGEKYLDFGAGIAVASLGYSPSASRRRR